MGKMKNAQNVCPSIKLPFIIIINFPLETEERLPSWFFNHLIFYYLFSLLSVTTETPRVNFCITSGIFALLNKTSHYEKKPCSLRCFDWSVSIISDQFDSGVKTLKNCVLGLCVFGSKVWRETDVRHVQRVICRYSKKKGVQITV